MFCRVGKSAIVFVSLVLALGLHVPQVQGQDIAPIINHSFGATAMAIGQTSRANIASIEDPNEFPPGTFCDYAINFFAADGNLLTRPISGQLDIGKSAFVDLNRNSLTIKDNRVPFRVVISVIGNPNITPDPCRSIRATVEIYDNLSGRTMVFIGDPTI